MKCMATMTIRSLPGVVGVLLSVVFGVMSRIPNSIRVVGIASSIVNAVVRIIVVLTFALVSSFATLIVFQLLYIPGVVSGATSIVKTGNHTSFAVGNQIVNLSNHLTNGGKQSFLPLYFVKHPDWRVMIFALNCPENMVKHPTAKSSVSTLRSASQSILADAAHSTLASTSPPVLTPDQEQNGDLVTQHQAQHGGLVSWRNGEDAYLYDYQAGITIGDVKSKVLFEHDHLNRWMLSIYVEIKSIPADDPAIAVEDPPHQDAPMDVDPEDGKVGSIGRISSDGRLNSGSVSSNKRVNSCDGRICSDEGLNSDRTYSGEASGGTHCSGMLNTGWPLGRLSASGGEGCHRVTFSGVDRFRHSGIVNFDRTEVVDVNIDNVAEWQEKQAAGIFECESDLSEIGDDDYPYDANPSEPFVSKVKYDAAMRDGVLNGTYHHGVARNDGTCNARGDGHAQRFVPSIGSHDSDPGIHYEPHGSDPRRGERHGSKCSKSSEARKGRAPVRSITPLPGEVPHDIVLPRVTHDGRSVARDDRGFIQDDGGFTRKVRSRSRTWNSFCDVPIVPATTESRPMPSSEPHDVKSPTPSRQTGEEYTKMSSRQSRDQPGGRDELVQSMMIETPGEEASSPRPQSRESCGGRAGSSHPQPFPRPHSREILCHSGEATAKKSGGHARGCHEGGCASDGTTCICDSDANGLEDCTTSSDNENRVIPAKPNSALGDVVVSVGDLESDHARDGGLHHDTRHPEGRDRADNILDPADRGVFRGNKNTETTGVSMKEIADTTTLAELVEEVSGRFDDISMKAGVLQGAASLQTPGGVTSHTAGVTKKSIPSRNPSPRYEIHLRCDIHTVAPSNRLLHTLRWTAEIFLGDKSPTRVLSPYTGGLLSPSSSTVPSSSVPSSVSPSRSVRPRQVTSPSGHLDAPMLSPSGEGSPSDSCSAEIPLPDSAQTPANVRHDVSMPGSMQKSQEEIVNQEIKTLLRSQESLWGFLGLIEYTLAGWKLKHRNRRDVREGSPTLFQEHESKKTFAFDVVEETELRKLEKSLREKKKRSRRRKMDTAKEQVNRSRRRKTETARELVNRLMLMAQPRIDSSSEIGADEDGIVRDFHSIHSLEGAQQTLSGKELDGGQTTSQDHVEAHADMAEHAPDHLAARSFWPGEKPPSLSLEEAVLVTSQPSASHRRGARTDGEIELADRLQDSPDSPEDCPPQHGLRLVCAYSPEDGLHPTTDDTQSTRALTGMTPLGATPVGTTPTATIEASRELDSFREQNAAREFVARQRHTFRPQLGLMKNKIFTMVNAGIDGLNRKKIQQKEDKAAKKKRALTVESFLANNVGYDRSAFQANLQRSAFHGYPSQGISFSEGRHSLQERENLQYGLAGSPFLGGVSFANGGAVESASSAISFVSETSAVICDPALDDGASLCERLGANLPHRLERLAPTFDRRSNVSQTAVVDAETSATIHGASFRGDHGGVASVAAESDQNSGVGFNSLQSRRKIGLKITPATRTAPQLFGTAASRGTPEVPSLEFRNSPNSAGSNAKDTVTSVGSNAAQSGRSTTAPSGMISMKRAPGLELGPKIRPSMRNDDEEIGSPEPQSREQSRHIPRFPSRLVPRNSSSVFSPTAIVRPMAGRAVTFGGEGTSRGAIPSFSGAAGGINPAVGGVREASGSGFVGQPLSHSSQEFRAVTYSGFMQAGSDGEDSRFSSRVGTIMSDFGGSCCSFESLVIDDASRYRDFNISTNIMQGMGQEMMGNMQRTVPQRMLPQSQGNLPPHLGRSADPKETLEVPVEVLPAYELRTPIFPPGHVASGNGELGSGGDEQRILQDFHEYDRVEDNLFAPVTSFKDLGRAYRMVKVDEEIGANGVVDNTAGGHQTTTGVTPGADNQGRAVEDRLQDDPCLTFYFSVGEPSVFAERIPSISSSLGVDQLVAAAAMERAKDREGNSDPFSKQSSISSDPPGSRRVPDRTSTSPRVPGDTTASVRVSGETVATRGVAAIPGVAAVPSGEPEHHTAPSTDDITIFKHLSHSSSQSLETKLKRMERLRKFSENKEKPKTHKIPKIKAEVRYSGCNAGRVQRQGAAEKIQELNRRKSNFFLDVKIYIYDHLEGPSPTWKLPMKADAAPEQVDSGHTSAGPDTSHVAMQLDAVSVSKQVGNAHTMPQDATDVRVGYPDITDHGEDYEEVEGVAKPRISGEALHDATQQRMDARATDVSRIDTHDSEMQLIGHFRVEEDRVKNTSSRDNRDAFSSDIENPDHGSKVGSKGGFSRDGVNADPATKRSQHSIVSVHSHGFGHDGVGSSDQKDQGADGSQQQNHHGSSQEQDEDDARTNRPGNRSKCSLESEARPDGTLTSLMADTIMDFPNKSGQGTQQYPQGRYTVSMHGGRVSPAVGSVQGRPVPAGLPGAVDESTLGTGGVPGSLPENLIETLPTFTEGENALIRKIMTRTDWEINSPELCRVAQSIIRKLNIQIDTRDSYFTKSKSIIREAITNKISGVQHVSDPWLLETHGGGQRRHSNRMATQQLTVYRETERSCKRSRTVPPMSRTSLSGGTQVGGWLAGHESTDDQYRGITDGQRRGSALFSHDKGYTIVSSGGHTLGSVGIVETFGQFEHSPESRDSSRDPSRHSSKLSSMAAVYHDTTGHHPSGHKMDAESKEKDTEEEFVARSPGFISMSLSQCPPGGLQRQGSPLLWDDNTPESGGNKKKGLPFSLGKSAMSIASRFSSSGRGKSNRSCVAPNPAPPTVLGSRAVWPSSAQSSHGHRAHSSQQAHGAQGSQQVFDSVVAIGSMEDVGSTQSRNDMNCQNGVRTGANVAAKSPAQKRSFSTSISSVIGGALSCARMKRKSVSGAVSEISDRERLRDAVSQEDDYFGDVLNQITAGRELLSTTHDTTNTIQQPEGSDYGDHYEYDKRSERLDHHYERRDSSSGKNQMMPLVLTSHQPLVSPSQMSTWWSGQNSSEGSYDGGSASASAASHQTSPQPPPPSSPNYHDQVSLPDYQQISPDIFSIPFPTNNNQFLPDHFSDNREAANRSSDEHPAANRSSTDEATNRLTSKGIFSWRPQILGSKRSQ